jgi:hypothetical protein
MSLETFLLEKRGVPAFSALPKWFHYQNDPKNLPSATAIFI